MHAAILCAAVYFSGFFAAPMPPVVEQTVEMVSVHHLGSGAELVGYFDLVQGSWTLLAHRWGFPDGGIRWTGELWSFDFYDETDACYRVIYARCWAEIWSEQDPRGDTNQPWFVQMLEPGLRAPPIQFAPW